MPHIGITADEFKASHRELGLSAEAPARLLGVNPRTIRGWEAGYRNGRPASVPKAVELILMALSQRRQAQDD
jgi:DNA-binding transcriptional regulator YiaG